MNDVVGQMSLLDFYKEETKEAPVLLKPGQIIYMVVRGDIEAYKVDNRTWNLAGTNRGYDLNSVDGSRKNVTWNRAINKNVFLNYTDAETISEEYIKNNECILAEEMYIKELVAFKHSFNEREIPEWYAVLDNDMIYFHYGCKYDHIGPSSEIKEFESGIKEHASHPIFDFEPHFHNMYKCDISSKWLYASAHYQYLYI